MLDHKKIWEEIIPKLKLSRQWHSKEDNEALYKIVQALPKNSWGVEIGTADGQSVITMILANDTLKVVCIDPEILVTSFLWNITSNRLSSRVDWIPTTSKGAFEKCKFEEKFNFVFIDAVHTYEAVKEDFLMWSSLLKKNGLIAFHDYHPNHPGSVRAIDECIINNKDYNIFLKQGAVVCGRKII